MNSLLYIVFMIPLCMTLEGNSLNELNINNNWYFREYSKENDNSQYLKAEVPGI